MTIADFLSHLSGDEDTMRPISEYGKFLSHLSGDEEIVRHD